MINVADKIKKAYENSTTQIDKIKINNKDYRITNVEYYDDCYLDGNIFGTAIGKMLEFEIENTIELEKAEVKYSTGLLINGIEHWISLGNFIVESIEPNDTTGINKVVAMDYMLKTNIEYESKLDYSSNKITLLQVLQEACTDSGLELATTSFANSNFIVDSNQFEEGTLNRQVIQAVAQISGTFAKIKSDNKLYLITPKRKGLLVKDVHVITVAELNALPVEKLSACDNEFNLNSYKELVIKRNTHPINLVSLGISDIEGENIVLRDENSISSDGENSLVINDNPFAYTQAKREQLITALFDCVKGFEYTAYEISGQSKPYLETGDEIVAIDKEGSLYNSFLLRFNFKSPKGLESEMSAPSITKATVAYQNVASALDIAKQTERKVDKQNQIIEDLVSQQTETTEKLNQVEMTVDGTKETIKSVETKVETAQSTADTATTKADNAQTSANNAQSTANTANTKADNAQNTADTANTNAQNAQKTADENTTKITTTTTKVAEIEKNVDGITNTVSETTKRLNNDYLTAEQVNAGIDGTKEDINILKQKQASTELTIDGFQIQIDTINNEGVNKVKTSMGYTFDDEGMKINKENADTGTIVDEAGFKVVDKTGYKETNLLYAGYVKEEDSNYPNYVGQTIVATSNIVIENYLVVGSNSRFEDYTNPTLGGKGTGVFEI